MKSRLQYSLGFTLIEMVVVLLILALLAKAAYSRYAKTDTQARITALNSMRSTLMTSASSAKGYCVSHRSCDASAHASQGINTTIEGRTVYLHYGYPVASQSGQASGGIAEMIDLGRFSLQTETANTLQADFVFNQAPDASNCKVRYQLANTNTMPVLNVSIISSGC